MKNYENNQFVPAKDASSALQAAAELILKSVGEKLGREGIERTPQRFAKAMQEICSGYQLTASDAVGEGIFPGEGGLVSVRDIEFFSLCEHHMLPFWGRINVAYLPAEKILGLSKIPRLVEVFAKRLQVQERLTREIAEGIVETVAPKAVVVRATGSHLCMMMRGVRKTGSETITEFSIGLDTLPPEQAARLWKSVE